MFQHALQFKDVIIICYNRKNIIRSIGKVPPLFTWHIKKKIVDFVVVVVSAYVLN
jgi:hypothetical protein